MKKDGKWHYEFSQQYGIETPYDLHEFVKNGNYLDHYDTEHLLNDLEELLQNAHDNMDGYNNRHLSKTSPNCKFCSGEGYDGNGLIHSEDCILVRIRQKLS